MALRKGHTFTDEDFIAAAALRETMAQARVASLGGGQVFERARVAQLSRDRDRALGKGDAARAAVLEAKLVEGTARGQFMVEQREREAVVPTPVPRGQATLRGRVTEAGRGRPSLRLGLIGPEGEEIASGVTDKRGAFDVAHDPVETLTVRVSARGGRMLLERRGLMPAQPGTSTYVELRTDGITPMDPPPGAPPPDTVPERISVPAIRGLAEAAARRALRDAGLRSRLAETVEADDMDGLVLKQEPEAGTPVAPDTVVSFVLGARQQERFPDLRGETLGNTISSLEERELTVQSIVLVRDPDNAGRVVDHVPAADAPFTGSSRVLLRVGTGADGADLTTAAVLFERDPRAQRIEFSGARFRRRIGDAGVERIDDLRELADTSVEELADKLQIDDRQVARTLQQMLRDLLAHFPEG